MSPRIQAFRALADHPIFRAVMDRLGKESIAECEKFITDFDHLDYAGFGAILHQWHVDSSPMTRPPHINQMYSVVMAANGAMLPKDLRKQLRASRKTGGTK